MSGLALRKQALRESGVLGRRGDLLFNLVLALVQAGQNDVAVVDWSKYRRPFGLRGNAALSNASTLFAPQAIVLDGTGDNANIQTAAHMTGMGIGTGDLCEEMVFYRGATGVEHVLWDTNSNVNQNGRKVRINSSDKLQYMQQTGPDTTTARITGTTSVTVGWHHAALVRISGSSMLFLDSVQEGSTYASDTYNFANNALFLGTTTNNMTGSETEGLNGIIDGYRLTANGRYGNGVPVLVDIFPTSR